MPLDKFVLLIVVVMAAAGATIFVASLGLATVAAPGLGLASLIPIGLIAFVIWRVIAQRLGNAEDDKYDHLEK
ncbi:MULTISPECIES: hypothetical protein [unclassified Dinoroseobacter]|uniref:hypothetical protein n=1 Tax=unclassified Dinoroseobacter TaxID=2620028 RepID=UPI003C7C0695